MTTHPFFSVFVVVCVYLSACSSGANHSVRVENELTVIAFPKELSLVGEGFVLDGALVRYPFRIRHDGDYIYLLDLHGEESFCHVLDERSFSHVASFATRGEGPQEALQVISLEVTSSSGIWAYDNSKRILTCWHFDEERDTLTCKLKYHVKDRLASSANMTLCSDSCFILTDRSGMSRAVLLNARGEPIQRIGSIPVKKEVSDDQRITLAQVWNSFLHYNPRNKVLAIGTQLGDILEVYDLKKGTRRTVRGALGEPTFQSTRDGFAVPTGIMGFSDVQVTDNYIYTVFHGRSFKEIAKDPDNTLDGGEYIQVYDLEGNPVCRFLLDHAIYGIHVNEEERIIWATDVNTEEQIVKYRIPEFE